MEKYLYKYCNISNMREKEEGRETGRDEGRKEGKEKEKKGKDGDTAQ